MSEDLRALDGFHPAVVQWFGQRFGRPTPIQELAWPRIAAGESVLLTAPTGSGKTLTAFLFAISRLLSGSWPHGELSVLYISPLKALNNDIRVNLADPLREIRERLIARGEDPPDIRVQTRSGDTPQNERQRMVRHPPEILITTPESLNLILSSHRARHILSTTRTVILDEIHAVIDSKRGTHLITAIERVNLLAGELQRIAVSATVRPLDVVARFVGGYRRVGDGYEVRPMTTLQSPGRKSMTLAVDFPVASESLRPDDDSNTDAIFPELIRRLKSIIARNRSTLIFVTTRRHAEKITGLLNEDSDDPIAYAHHGSLSRELRTFVEGSLKAGRLRAIVATNSLELGIDIGELDEIVMVQSPFSVSSALQRLGRAGHRVDETSAGTLFPLFGRDAIDAAVVSHAALQQDIEPSAPITAPLDVLAQQIISMTAVEVWDIDELFAELRCSWPYRDLDRRAYDLVIEMLAGRYQQTRIRDLKPRVMIDRIDNSIRAREGVLPLLYQSGGTIPDRGYFGLRLAGEGAKIGELDEEFVWERHVGDTFYLGSQLWTIRSIGDRDVEVVPGSPGQHIVPFWKAEARGRGSHMGRATLEFLEQCEFAIAHDGLDAFLEGYPELTESTRHVIADTLASQRAATRTALPHRHHIVVENYLRPMEGPSGRRRPAALAEQVGRDAQEIIVHCPWGMGVTQPLSMAIAALWEGDGHPVEVFSDDNCLVFLAPPEVKPEVLLSPDIARKLLRSDRIEELLRVKLEHSGLFGAMFRENAGRALLLPRGGFDRRMPLWLNRLKSRKLLGAVEAYDDFPILLETWRSCLQDRFDLPALRELLSEISSGAIALSWCETTNPSPFATEVVWRQTNLYMYADDSRPGGSGTALTADILRLAATNAAIRPDIPAALVAELEKRLQRVAPGYAPTSSEDLVDWVRERLILPEDEVRLLHAAIVRDASGSDGVPPALEGRLCWIRARDGWLLAAVEQLPIVNLIIGAPFDAVAADATRWWDPDAGVAAGNEPSAMPSPDSEPPDAAATLAQWLGFYGPRTLSWLSNALGADSLHVERLLEELVDGGVVITGRFTEATDQIEFCDRENLEHLLALLRRSHRQVVEPVDPALLTGLWARTTGLAREKPGEPDDLPQVLDVLFGFPASIGLWETDIFPARLPDYYPVWMDGLLKESDLVWFGSGRERIAFALQEDLEFIGREVSEPESDTERSVIESLETGDKPFFDLRDLIDAKSEEVSSALWAATWHGLVSNDSYETVRNGIISGFKPIAPAVANRSRRGSGRGGWARSRPISGRWFRLPREAGTNDPIAELETDKDRARILVGRYGIVFRELVDHELPGVRWSGVFRALRMMELSGEVTAGAFVKGIDAIQFASPSALSVLNHPPGGIYWMNAMDPASPCGLSIGRRNGSLPTRVASNHLVYRGVDLVMVSRRNGAELEFLTDPSDPDTGEILGPLRSMVARNWNARARVAVETINGAPALESPFADALIRHGFRRDYRRLVLSAGYR